MLSSLKKIKRAIRANLILESFPETAIATFDRELRFQYVNGAATRLLRRKDDIVGKTIYETLPVGDAIKLSNHLQRVLGNPTAVDFEEYLDKAKVWYAFHCSPTQGGITCQFSDITEKKRQDVLRPLPIWNEDREFIRIFEKIEYTLVDHARCHILHQFAKQTADLPGDMAEVGVYKGGTAKLLALTIAPRAKKTLHLFDTFSGMPPTQAETDHHHEGDLADTSLEMVQRTLKQCANVKIYKGFFPDTAGPIENSRFSMVHIDADIYQSVKDSCVFFYPRLEKAGVMVFDDYGFSSCPGARKAVDEFFSDKTEFPFYLPTGQCFVVKK